MVFPKKGYQWLFGQHPKDLARIHDELVDIRLEVNKFYSTWHETGNVCGRLLVEEQHEMIMWQKIAGLYPTQDVEGWAEWRRTGYPRVQVGSDEDDLQGESYRRYMWPDAEQVLNADNYNEALSRIGGNDHPLVKVWWDANPNAPHEHPDQVPSQPAPWI